MEDVVTFLFYFFPKFGFVVIKMEKFNENNMLVKRTSVDGVVQIEAQSACEVLRYYRENKYVSNT